MLLHSDSVVHVIATLLPAVHWHLRPVSRSPVGVQHAESVGPLPTARLLRVLSCLHAYILFTADWPTSCLSSHTQASDASTADEHTEMQAHFAALTSSADACHVVMQILSSILP